jgi:fatty-acyl-CoA synthase
MGVVHGASYSSAIAEALRHYPERDAFIHGDRRLTYAETAQQISQIQQLLESLGVGYQGQVVVLSKNAPEVWLVQAAAYLIGARYSGLHPLGSVDDWAFICDDAEAEVLIVHPFFAEAARQIAERCPGIRHVLVVGESEVGDDLRVRMREFDPRPLEPGPATAEDTAWLQYTGGTTGKPKGVMVPQRAMLQMYTVPMGFWQLPEVPRFLAVAPITHAGTVGIFSSLLRGGSIVLLEDFDPGTVLRTIEEHRISWTVWVPTMIYALLDNTDPSKYDLSSLQTVIYASSPIYPSRLEQALNVFGNVFVQCYGMSEAAATITVLPKEDHDPVNRPSLLTSCGKPLPSTQLEIHDDDDQPVPVGTPGEVVLRSQNVMTGYWKMPELTAEAMRNDWFHTTDIGVLDKEGYLHLVDRKKDMVITGGFNVYPREVEDVIAKHPAVASVAVVGLPDPKWGEAVTAYVVLHPDVSLDPADVKALVREAKGAHQAPKHVVIIDHLPMTSVGKIDKKQLRVLGLPGGESA